MKSTFPHITSRLAQEIIDNIIDCCSSPRDLKILKVLSLVCRAFLPRSQRHIFVGIRLACAIHQGEIKTGGRRLDELYDILQHSPHIAGYVREIRLVVKDNDSWAAGNPKFEWIMDHLTRNRVFNRFHIDCHLSGDKVMIAPVHLSSFEQCFSQRYIVPFITSLKLYRVKNIPISLLVSSPGLQKLSLIRVTLGDMPSNPPSLHNTTLPKLQALFFYRSSDTVTALLGNSQNGSPPLLDLSHLYTLSVNQDSLEDIQCAIRIIQVTSRSLRQINFIHRNSNVYIPMTGLINLATIPHLRALRLDTVCGDKAALADLTNILDTVQPLHKIAKVRVTLHVSDRTRLFPGDTLDAGCTVLDSAITKLHHKKDMTFDLQFFFPPQSSRILISKRKRAFAEIGEMSRLQFSNLVLGKLPLATMSPGVTITIARQKDHMPQGVLRNMQKFLRRLRELVRERS